MNLEYAFFCEDVSSDSGNTVTVTRIFTALESAAFPYTAPELVAALCIRFSMAETYESKAIELHLFDSDGLAVMRPVRREAVQIPQPVEGRLYRSHLFVHHLRQGRFPKPDDYQLSWLVNGIEAHSLPLRVSSSG